MVEFRTKSGQIVKFKAKGEKKSRKVKTMVRRQRRYLPAVRSRVRAYYPRARRYGRKGANFLAKTGGVSTWLAHVNLLMQLHVPQRVSNVLRNPTGTELQGQVTDSFKDLKANIGPIVAAYAAVLGIKLVKRIFKPKGMGWL